MAAASTPPMMASAPTPPSLSDFSSLMLTVELPAGVDVFWESTGVSDGLMTPVELPGGEAVG